MKFGETLRGRDSQRMNGAWRETEKLIGERREKDQGEGEKETHRGGRVGTCKQRTPQSKPKH